MSSYSSEIKSNSKISFYFNNYEITKDSQNEIIEIIKERFKKEL